MNISEATKEALKTNACIIRTTSIAYGQFKLKPTNTDECCIIFSVDKTVPPIRGWQPRAEDLVSNDWIVID